MGNKLQMNEYADLLQDIKYLESVWKVISKVLKDE